MSGVRLFLFCLLIITSLQAQKKEILQVMHDQQLAWNQGDLEGYMRGYWKNDYLMFIGENEVTYGWDNTLKNYKTSYATGDKMGTLQFSDQRVTFLNKNLATVYGRWALRREKDQPSGIYTLIFKKFPEGWRIIQDHTQ